MSQPKPMKALILVGGFGTRLRPLTLTMPKPLVPFCNKPMIIHQIEALKEAGVTEVILAVAYQPDAMKVIMDEWSVKLGIKFVYSHEKTPLGTAGPLALAKDLLMDGQDNFFVLNADVTCKYPLKQLLDLHRSHAGAEGTILVTQVEQWSKYGVVVHDEATGLVDRFVEKPKDFVGDKINAGIYVLNKAILNRIPLQKTSIETQVFPKVAAEKKLYCMHLEGYWMDVGQPMDFLDGIGRYLPSLVGTPKEAMLCSPEEAKRRGFTVNGCVLIDPTAQVEPGCMLGPNVTIAPKCRIGASCRLINCAILENSVVETGCYINRSIVGWNNTVGRWSRIDNGCVFGDDVQVKPELYVNGARVLPNKGISVTIDKPEIIM